MKKYAMTVKDIAENFNVSRRTIFNWIEVDKMPSVKLGGAIRFSEEDVQAWVDKQSNNYGHEKRA